MNSRIVFGAILALALSVGLSSRALAQKPDNKTEPATQQPAATQPDNDNAAVPAAQQPAARPDRDDMSKPADQDRDKDNMSKAAPGEHDISKQELATFDNFLDSHPKIARDLREDPARVNDAAWVSSHPELKEFLGSHPRIREEAKEHPRVFMNHEKRFEQREKR